MKKRILSLLLAFAMAATLAPATALVGTSVSKAAAATATPTFTVGSTAGGSNIATAGITTGNSTITRGATASKLYVQISNAGTMIGDGGIAISASADAGLVVTPVNVDLTAGTAEYNVFADYGASDSSKVAIKVTNDRATDNEATCTITYTVSDMSSTVTADNEVNGVLSDNTGNASGAFSGITGNNTLLTITPANNSATVTYASGYAGTNNLNFTYTLTADSNTMSSPVQPKVTVTRTGSTLNDFNVTFSDVHASTYGDWLFTYTISGAGFTSVTGSTVIKVANTYKVTYDLGGGTVSNAAYTLEGNKYVTLEEVTGGVASHTMLAATDVTKPGEVLVKFVDGNGNDVAASTNTSNVQTLTGDVTYKAVYRKATVQILFEGGTGLTPQPFITRNGRTDTRTAVVENVSVGSALNGSVLSRDGYKLIGWSLKPGATVAQYAPNATLTSDMLVAATENAHDGEFTQAGNDSANKLYAVWQAKETTINFNINTPSDGKVSSASRNMSPIKFNYGSTISDFPANTFAVDGYAFVGWSLDPAGNSRDLTNMYNAVGTPGQTAGFNWTIAGQNVSFGTGTADGYLGIGINGRSQNLTLYAIWEKGTNVVLYDAPVNQSPKVFDVISYNGATKDIGGSTTLPGTTNKIGSRVLRWVTADGDVNAVGANVNSVGGNVSLYPVYEANEYRVIYDPATNGGALESGVASIVVFKLADFASLNTPIASRANSVFTRWTVWDNNTQIFEPDGSPVVFTTSFSSAKVVEIMDARSIQTITLRAEYISKVDGARVRNTYTAAYPYGTPIKNITRDLESNIILTFKGTDITAPGTSISNVVWSTTPSYVQDDKRMIVYKFTGKVTPNANGVSVVNGPFEVNASVTVNAKAVSGPVALTIADTIINLPAGANARDVLAALEGVKTVKVTADNSVTYTVNTLTASSDWENVSALDDGDWSNVFEGDANPHTWVFRTDSSLEYTGLYFEDGVALGLTANNDRAYVIINIAGGTRNPVSDSADAVDPYAEELEKAQALLDKGVVARLYNAKTSTHYYCTKIDEIEALIRLQGCTVEGNESFKFSATKTEVYDTPIYRLSTPGKGYIYEFEAQKDAIMKNYSHLWKVNAGGAPIFYVNMDSKNPTMYRMYNKVLGTLVYSPKAERDLLMKYPNIWEDQTTAYNMWRTPAN